MAWGQRFARGGAGVGASGLGNSAGGFLQWWRRSLLAWLPLRARQALDFQRGRLLLLSEGEGVEVRLQLESEIIDLGHVPAFALDADELSTPPSDPLAALLPTRLADLPRWLLLPASTGLRRRMPLPAAAADRLRDVVGFEIDRQTPFSADQVAFDARILGRRDSDGQLDTELVAVPRTALDARMATLGVLASTVAGIDIVAGDGSPLGVNLLAPELRRTRVDPWRVWNLALLSAAVLLTALMLWQLLQNRRAAADAFAQEIRRHAQPARRAAADRAELLALIEGQAFLDRTRAERPTAVEVLDDVSRRLPDDTYLEKFAIEQDALTLIGLSSQAAALVGALQESKVVNEPALAGALMPDPGTRRDRFTLTAKLTPAPAAKAARGAR